MLLIENIKLALSAIRVNKMRSFLTMLGIIIGISSVIAITSIGDSAKGAVSKEFEGYTANMYIMINWEMVDEYIRDDDLFYEEDIQALKARFPDQVRYAAPYGGASSETKVGRLKGKLQMSGVGADYFTDYSCFVPYSITMQPGEGSSYVNIYANENMDQTKQAEDFVKYLNKIKGKQEGFYRYETAESQLGMINNVLGILSIAIGAIAAISLLVGGIGIMNIMLVSVTERTREIGIRKSLGAQTKDILTQFLIEAMILSVIGGIIGTALGIGIAALGMTIAGVGVVVNPMVILVAVAFSAFVGVFFGIFPAKKAAKLDPIEALRYE